MRFPSPRKPTPKNILQRAFNEGKYHQLVLEGRLQTITLEDKHPSPPRSGDPPCTRSQILVYITPDQKPVALVHQYVRPDGKLGGSGKPDPKMLVVNDETLSAQIDL